MEKNCKVDRTGEKYLTNEGYWLTIIEYFGWDNCTIQFECGLVLNCIRYDHIKNGRIKNPLHTSTYGIGYIGVGTYKAEVGKKVCVNYMVWQGMLRRCYSKKYKDKNPTYKDVTVCEEWHNFQNFAAWFEENHIEGFHLDKDILVKENKIYSPETCCFVPAEINTLLTKTNSKRGKYPIGVCFSKRGRKFGASFNKEGKKLHLGFFNTPEEAFQAYKTAKEEYIKEVADKWRKQITEQTYQALINYKVEITD
ncbi:MAG TPA: hypothetical protein VLA48_03380 [Nitrososphaeraceae archaeon]|nr:hypothetical protein [Nitrososphaeraceae archaeon]